MTRCHLRRPLAMSSAHIVRALLHSVAAITHSVISTLLGASATAIALLLAVFAYNLWFHPLSSVPGPKLAAASNLWLAYQARNGRLAELGRTLHRQYGEAVRVGPNEVWFNSKAAFKAIYSESIFPGPCEMQRANQHTRCWKRL